MIKKLYYTVSNGDGSIIAEISGCMEWVKGDTEANYNDPNLSDEDKPEYTLTPVWMTDEEFEALPESEY